MSRDSRYEQWLTSLGIEYEYLPTVALDKFDVSESLRNQARMDKVLDADRVTEYAVAMLDGAAFPPLIAWRRADGMYVLITGNHRLAAAREAKLTHFDVYRVITAENDVYLRDVLTRTANVVEGVTLSRSDRIAQAAHICKLYTRPATEVAKKFGIHPTTLSAELRREETDERLLRLGRSPEKLGVKNRANLAALQSDAVLGEAARFLEETRANEPKTRELIKELLERRGEASQLVYLNELRESAEVKLRLAHTSKGRASGRAGVRSMLLMHLGSVDGILKKYPTPAALQVTNLQDAKKIAALARDIEFRATRLLNVLTKEIADGASEALREKA